ncbi:hypothetical protein HYH03_010275 [Edaphochlamys debaryana]|uniref:Protein kinase domain-containing protein n=1 Tax=Edaphochlamys debaryana TaxID=47281 RepID=A0A835XWI4_9CHLO|nr:hypothetical protein HYH03_010275 [Edaphochlamys debaryana]|eukprot:KAG2491491.1 hypothetical protein HYH03_010275 [Edaphochlamys debaryana]
MKDTVRLSAGVTLLFVNVTLGRFQSESLVARAVGLDFVEPPTDGGRAFVELLDSGVVLPGCFTPSINLTQLPTWARPADFPAGPQAVDLGVQPGAFPDCLNGSGRVLGVVLQQPAGLRCMERVDRTNAVLQGSTTDPSTHRIESTALVFVYRDVLTYCTAIVDDACIAAVGIHGCYTALVKGIRMIVRGNTTRPSPAADGPAVPPQLEQLTALPPDGNNNRDDSSRLVGIIVGSILGGFMVLGLVGAALGLVWWRRRQRGLRDQDMEEAGKAQRSPRPKPSVHPSPAPSSFHLTALCGDSVQTCDSMPAMTLTTGRGGSVAGGAALLASMPDGMLLPVTQLSPLRPDLQLGVRMAGDSPTQEAEEVEDDRVELLPVCKGKGAFGKVYEGRFRGERVAVKLVSTGLLEALPPAAVGTSEAGKGNGAAAGAGGQGSGKRGAGGPEGDGAGPTERAFASNTFRAEVEVLGRLSHPNIVRLLAASLEPPKVCLVMELMDTSLDKVLYGTPGALLPLTKVLHIGIQICQGLAYLHPTITHRDLKPANVLLRDPDSPTPIVKLADFGLARMRVATMPTEDPESGTPEYLAPECYDITNNVVTHRADMYAVGVVLWAMLTGGRPWQGVPWLALAVKVKLRNERLSLSSLTRDRCPPKLRKLVKDCFEGEPRRRPAAEEAAKMLTLVQQEVLRSSDSSSSNPSPLCSSATSSGPLPPAPGPWPAPHPAGEAHGEPAGVAVNVAHPGHNFKLQHDLLAPADDARPRRQ